MPIPDAELGRLGRQRQTGLGLFEISAFVVQRGLPAKPTPGNVPRMTEFPQAREPATN